MFHRSNRDLCRDLLGHKKVVFIVLNLTKSCQKKRLEARHGGDGGGEWAACLGKGPCTYDVSEKSNFCNPLFVSSPNLLS